MDDFFTQEPCAECGGNGRCIDSGAVSRSVKGLIALHGRREFINKIGLTEVYLRSLLNGHRRWTMPLLLKVAAIRAETEPPLP